MNKTTKLWLLVAAASVWAGCKTRNPDAPGLLEDGGDSASASATEEAGAPVASPTSLALSEAAPADQRRWNLTCWSVEDQKKDTVYELAVSSVVSAASGEAQPMQTTLTVIQHGQRRSLGTSLDGHGHLNGNGPMLIAFASGVLTGEITGREAQGILTLSPAAGGGADALKVSCLVQAIQG